MNVHQLALLLAVVVQVAPIFVLNLWLYVRGERGVLLLPGLDRYPAVEREAEAPVAAQADAAVVEEEPQRKAA
jgi:hypothetical protein